MNFWDFFQFKNIYSVIQIPEFEILSSVSIT